MGERAFAVLGVVVALCAGLVSGDPVRCAVPEGAELLLRVSICVYESQRVCWNVWEKTLTYTRAPDITAQFNITLPEEALRYNNTLFAQATLQHKNTYVANFRTPLMFYKQREPAKMFLLDPLLARINPDNKRVQERLAAVAAERAHEHEFVMYWRPFLHILLRVETDVFPTLSDVPLILRQFVNTDTDKYLPLVAIGTSELGSDVFPEDSQQGERAVMPLSVRVDRSASRGLLWSVLAALKMEELNIHGYTVDDIELIKSTLLQWPYVLLFVMGVMQLVFDFLSAKNDIAFWGSRRSDLCGVSSTTVVLNALAKLIVLLYLWDNNASLFNLAFAVHRVIIEGWKVFSVLALGSRSTMTTNALVETDEADRQASRWVRTRMEPVALTLAVYTLVWVLQRSWWSWLLGSLTNLVTLFCFVTIVPQFVVTHRVRTIAHRPWRALVYCTFSRLINSFLFLSAKISPVNAIVFLNECAVLLVLLIQRMKYPVSDPRVMHPPAPCA